MQPIKPTTQAIKDRFGKAVMARKTADKAAVKSRGTEVLGFLRKQIKGDLECLEAVFLGHNDFSAIAEHIEPPASVDEK